MKFSLILLFLLVAVTANAMSRIVVPTLPLVGFSDIEETTNVAFVTSGTGIQALEVRIEYTGTDSNCVEIAFGRDADGNGDLAAEEMRLLFGWRGGRRFVEDVALDERTYEEAAPASGRRFLSLSVRTDWKRVPRKATFTCESGPCFVSLAADAPRFLCDSSWNLVKVVRRGAFDANERCVVRSDAQKFVLMVR